MFAAMGALRSITVDDQWTMTIGDLDVWPVFDGLAREDPTALYRVSHGEATAKGFAAEDWLPHRDLLNASGQIEHAYGGFLVRSGDRLVLIDAGVGPGQIGPYGPAKRVIRGGALLYSLALIGVALTDITDVILTHLHPDHYGWATAEAAACSPMRRSAATHSTGTTSSPTRARRARSRRRSSRSPRGSRPSIATARSFPASTRSWRPATRREARSSCSTRARNGRCCSAT